jgi:hypothetical protein
MFAYDLPKHCEKSQIHIERGDGSNFPEIIFKEELNQRIGVYHQIEIERRLRKQDIPIS